MSPRFILRKLLTAIVTLFVAATFNFFLFRLVSGDPIAAVYRGKNLSEEKKDEIRARFCLDRPKPQQFVCYLDELAHGHLGRTISGRPVESEIADRLWPTISLVGVSTILAAVLGIWLGIHAGWKPGGWFDRLSTSTTMFFYSTSDAFFGLVLLYVFAEKLQWFPSGGLTDPASDATGLVKVFEQIHHMILPATVLTVGYLGQYTLVMRASILEIRGDDYLQLARAKGLRDAEVRKRHATPNALLPSITLVALNLGFVLGGAIVVETIFSWPGLGLAFTNAAKTPDFALLQGLFLLVSATVILFTLAADLLYARLDPRVAHA